MSFDGDIVIPAGLAKVMDQAQFSDGSRALRIHNFNVDERGNLDSTFHIMPMIGDGWCHGDGTAPDAFETGDGCIGLYFARFDGLVPQILFVTMSGVFQFAPWTRSGSSANGGLIEQKHFVRFGTGDTEEVSVTPITRRWYPPQFEQVGNRVYLTLGDGGRAWVWDGVRLRHFGYQERPGAPVALGPDSDSDTASNNAGGFSVAGRVGTTDAQVGDYGALIEGHWEYKVVLENPDGAYSQSSPASEPLFVQSDLAVLDGSVPENPDRFRRRFWLREIGKGPDPTAARILLRTPNLRAVPAGVSPGFHFLHRLPSNVGIEWVDDIPDGELGPEWADRAPAPLGFYFLSWLNGSLFCFATDGDPSRCWWSEQDSVNGPTPESFIDGHWRDIYPGTGPIRGVHKARLPGDLSAAAILVFKERGVHFITGQYPAWSVGTLHEAAGLCGPNLVQSTPDGSVVWFGAGTFWQLQPDGSVVDIGGTIRDDLARVNHARSRIGSSYVDGRRGEARFIVAIDDMSTCQYQFIWDYREQGWRTSETVKVRAALRIEEDDLTLLAGTFNSLQTVWVLGRTYPHYSYTHPTATYQTGWLTLPGGKRMPLGSHWIPHEVILTLEERAEGEGTLTGYVDWDETTTLDEFGEVPLNHPEDTPSYYSITATAAADPAVYGTDVWRTRRVFSTKVGLDTGTTQALSLKLVATTPMCFLGMDVAGSYIANAGGRTPQGAH